jgi:hypothetical protein
MYHLLEKDYIVDVSIKIKRRDIVANTHFYDFIDHLKIALFDSLQQSKKVYFVSGLWVLSNIVTYSCCKRIWLMFNRNLTMKLSKSNNRPLAK